MWEKVMIVQNRTLVLLITGKKGEILTATNSRYFTFMMYLPCPLNSSIKMSGA